MQPRRLAQKLKRQKLDKQKLTGKKYWGEGCVSGEKQYIGTGDEVFFWY